RVHFLFFDEFPPRNLIDTNLHLLAKPLVMGEQTRDGLIHELVRTPSRPRGKFVKLIFLLPGQANFHTCQCSTGIPAQCHLVFRLSEGAGAAASPEWTRIGAAFAAAGKSTICSKIQNSTELLFGLLFGRGADEPVPSTIHHGENLSKTELTRINAIAASGQA